MRSRCMMILMMAVCLTGGTAAQTTAWAAGTADEESVQLGSDAGLDSAAGTESSAGKESSAQTTSADTNESKATSAAPTQPETAETKAVSQKLRTSKGIMLGHYQDWPKTRWFILTAKSYTRVFSKRSKKSKVLGSFTKNNCIVLNRDKMKKNVRYSWLPVKMPGGKTGYVRFQQVKISWIDTKTFGLNLSVSKNRTRANVCRYPLKYLGTRFVLGGRSFTSGIDCSTMIRTILRHYGVYVPSNATARVLSGRGKAIRRSQLKPGDLLFYYQSSSERYIAHSAIYIGRGFIVNASGHQGHYYPSGGIRLSRIDYRYPTAVRFRNVIGG